MRLHMCVLVVDITIFLTMVKKSLNTSRLDHLKFPQSLKCLNFRNKLKEEQEGLQWQEWKVRVTDNSVSWSRAKAVRVRDNSVPLILSTSYEDKQSVNLLYRIPLPGEHWENKKVIKSLEDYRRVCKNQYTVILIYQRPIIIVTKGRPFTYMEVKGGSMQVIGISYLPSFKLNLANPTSASLCFDLQLLEYEIACTLQMMRHVPVIPAQQ